MLKNDSLKSADGPAAVTTRRRLLHVAATDAATAPLAALTAGGAAQAAPEPPATAPRRIQRAILAPRFGGDVTADWYPEALRQLSGRGITTKVVSLLPAPTAPGIDETVAPLPKQSGTIRGRIAQTILIGHSVGSRALLAYLSRHGAHRTFAGLVSVAGWFTVDDLKSYPALTPWVNMDLHFASIASAAGPITVHLSDNGRVVALLPAPTAPGIGHYMTTNPGPVLATIRVASLANT